MTDNIGEVRNPAEAPTPLTVGLNQRFPALRPPLESWSNYTYHVSPFQGESCMTTLHSGVLPDLQMQAILEFDVERFRRENPGKNPYEAMQREPWDLRIEADKKHLYELGMLTPPPKKGILTKLSYPAIDVYGGPMFGGLVFAPDTLEQVKGLRTRFYLPDGEYIAKPNPSHLEEGELVFIDLEKVGEEGKGYYREVVDPRNQEELGKIDAMFTYE